MRISLIILLFLSLISILFIKFIWVNTPEFWSFGYEIGEIVYGLSIGYIAAFIFYVIDVWLPKKSEQNKINDRLAVPLSRLLNNMKIPLKQVYKEYGKDNYDFENMTEEMHKDIVSRMDLINDEAPMIFLDQDRNANYGEYLYSKIESVNMYIEKVFKLPIPLEIELVELLDDIETSSYHEVMTSANRASRFKKNLLKMKGTAINKGLYEYYTMYFKLRRYMKEKDIE